MILWCEQPYALGDFHLNLNFGLGPKSDIEVIQIDTLPLTPLAFSNVRWLRREPELLVPGKGTGGASTYRPSYPLISRIQILR